MAADPEFDSVSDGFDSVPDSEVEQMLDLVEYVARSLVDDPDAVGVRAVEEDRRIVYELTVAESDLGKVIGKDGRTARAIRTLLSATSAKLHKRAILEILE